MLTRPAAPPGFGDGLPGLRALSCGWPCVSAAARTVCLGPRLRQFCTPFRPTSPFLSPPSFSPLSPEFLYLTLELAPGIHGLGVVGLALVRPGHPAFGPSGGFVHVVVGFPQGVAPAPVPWLRVGSVVSSLRVLDLVSYPWRQ